MKQRFGPHKNCLWYLYEISIMRMSRDENGSKSYHKIILLKPEVQATLEDKYQNEYALETYYLNTRQNMRSDRIVKSKLVRCRPCLEISTRVQSSTSIKTLIFYKKFQQSRYFTLCSGSKYRSSSPFLCSHYRQIQTI